MKYLSIVLLTIILASCSAIPISISTRTPAVVTPSETVVPSVEPSSTMAPTVMSTFTPYPTYTLRPTYTRYPTYTPFPIESPYPTYTGYPTFFVSASATPYPTYTLYPTYTERPTWTAMPKVVCATSTEAAATATVEEMTGDPLKSKKAPGVYLVNVDMAAGLWRSTGTGNGCYWEINSKSGDIINNYFGAAGGSMNIKSDAFQVTMKAECGDWEYIGE